MEKTSRGVVSAAVVAEATEVIQIVKIMRVISIECVRPLSAESAKCNSPGQRPGNSWFGNTVAPTGRNRYSALTALDGF